MNGCQIVASNNVANSKYTGEQDRCQEQQSHRDPWNLTPLSSPYLGGVHTHGMCTEIS